MTTPRRYRFRSIRTCGLLSAALFPLAFSLSLQGQRAPAGEVSGEIEEFVGLSGEDPNAVLPNIPVEGSFGFSKTLLETPRAVSLISSEMIDRLSLSAVEDLVRVVPGVFTTTRFGIQGGIDVRNVPADTYFRGMRRVSLQGNARSVLAAMDNIEVVKGPPSPIFGMGKIGGYTNVSPKSGRARSGQYLTAPEGFVQAITGSWDKSEISFGVGGPLALGNRKGGYFVYGLIEDSDAFARGVPIEQEIIQAAVSLDNLIGPFRLESGFSYQVSRTAGALTGRFTQDLVDTGRYIRGTPLVNLDLNGSGMIGIIEMFRASPVRGSISGSNLPLIQDWAWPVDATGKPLPLDQFPRVPGIPQTMYDYLVANPDKDPSGLLRAQGPGGPLPVSGRVPVGMVLDPTTVGYDTYDMRRSAAFERELRAELLTGYFDLIYDLDPDFTIKNQLFADSMDQYKISNQPFSPKNDIAVFEDKLTVTKRFSNLPDWLDLNSLASANYRYTRAAVRSSGGDYGTHRSDAMAPTWVDYFGGMTANTTFANPFDNPNYDEDGFPWTSNSRTDFTEMGLGVLFDSQVLERTSLLVGGRFDVSTAKNVNYAGIYAMGGAGTSNANPMRLISSETTAKNTDNGYSWSVSLSHRLPYGVVPYVTFARSSLALDNASNQISNNIINAGHIGAAELKEAGAKTNLLQNKLFLAIALYEQTRISFTDDPNDPTAGAFATSTTTTGGELEVKWAPNRAFFVSAYALSQRTEYTPNEAGTLLVDARTLGFQDVVDPATGAIVFPAEAFLYGGRSRIRLPVGMEEYKYKAGNPETQFGLTTGYTFANRIALTLSGNRFSAVDTGRLGVVRLPQQDVLNASISWSIGRWDLKADIFNLTDERYFKPRTGDTLGDALAQAMPSRRWQAMIRYRF
jgi:iron complex outermembrane recepter protein